MSYVNSATVRSDDVVMLTAEEFLFRCLLTSRAKWRKLYRPQLQAVAPQTVGVVTRGRAEVARQPDSQLAARGLARLIAPDAEPKNKRSQCVCGQINTRHCPVHGQDAA